MADGLCSYAGNPHHQRARLLELTPGGRSSLRGIDGAQRRWCDALGAVIGEGPLRQTAVSLRRVIDVVEQADRPGTAPGRPQRAGE